MPIKFTCPHCKRGFVFKDQFAGKRGACPGCKKIVTIPNAAPTASAPKPPPAPAQAEPPPVPADIEAHAAALFSDEPRSAEPADTKTIDFNCPYCDEPIKLSADLAGKRAQCPECKQIIKVPE